MTRRSGAAVIGTVIGGRYLVEAPLAQGTFSQLYLARHRELGRRFAIKILTGGLSDPSLRVRFTQEARAASKLFHPNVASVCDFGRTPRGELYLVMDYAGQRTLLDVIDEEAPLHPRRVISLARGICRGLEHIHGHGLIHRDLKPANVVIDDDGRPRIVDFGLAFSPEGGDCGARVTSHGLVVGTPHYVSPEQAYGQPLDCRTDLFSLGLVLYEMLVGRLPFSGSSSQIAQQNATATPPPMSALNPRLRVPVEVERLVDQLLMKRVERRAPSARAVIEELDRIELAWHAPTSAVAPVTPPRARSSRRLALGLLFAAGSVALLSLPWALDDSYSAADPQAARPGVSAPPPDTRAIARRIHAPKAARADAGLSGPAIRTQPDAKAPRSERSDRASSERGGASAARLARRYRAVGSGIADLAGDFGQESIEDLRREFFALPYAEALRSRRARRAMFSALADLARELEQRRALLLERRRSASASLD